jgi:hypothetical protein
MSVERSHAKTCCFGNILHIGFGLSALNEELLRGFEHDRAIRCFLLYAKVGHRKNL